MGAGAGRVHARRGRRRRAARDLRRDRSPGGAPRAAGTSPAEAARKWVALAPEDAGALAARARVRRHNGEFEAALELFLDAAARETTGTAQAALLTEAAPDRTGRRRQGERARSQEEQAVELYVRALAADPDHAPAAERLAEIYASRGRWADVEELLDIVIDGLEPGETDRLVALEMKLAEACVQLGKTDKNKMDKALDAWRARTRPASRVAARAAQVRRPAHAAARVEGRADAVRSDPARPAPDAVAVRVRRDRDADRRPATSSSGTRTRAFAAYQEAKALRSDSTARRWTRWRRRTRRRATGRRGWWSGASSPTSPSPRRSRCIEEEIGDAYAEQAVRSGARRGVLPRRAGPGGRAALDAAQAAGALHEAGDAGSRRSIC